MSTLPELFNQLRPLLPPDNAEHELLWLFSHYTELPLPELRRRQTAAIYHRLAAILGF